MAKKQDMADKLRGSLGKISPKEEKSASEKTAPSKAPKGSGSGKLEKAPRQERTRGRAKNLALYPEDFEKMREIQDAIQDATGERPNDSLAVRIAIRSTKRDTKSLVAMYRKLRKQDNRFKR